MSAPATTAPIMLKLWYQEYVIGGAFTLQPSASTIILTMRGLVKTLKRKCELLLVV